MGQSAASYPWRQKAIDTAVDHGWRGGLAARLIAWAAAVDSETTFAVCMSFAETALERKRFAMAGDRVSPARVAIGDRLHHYLMPGVFTVIDIDPDRAYLLLDHPERGGPVPIGQLVREFTRAD